LRERYFYTEIYKYTNGEVFRVKVWKIIVKRQDEFDFAVFDQKTGNGLISSVVQFLKNALMIRGC